MQGLSEVVGRNVRRLRMEAGLTQDALAAVCKRHGLGWTATRVAQCEAGEVSPTLPTLLLLSAALSTVTGGATALADIVATDGPVELAPGVLVRGADLAAVVRGEPGASLLRDAVRIGGVTPDPVRAEVQQGWTRADTAVCKSLGIDREFGERIMAELWGRSMSAERDRRADPNVRSRGLATKALTAELRAAADSWADADE